MHLSVKGEEVKSKRLKEKWPLYPELVLIIVKQTQNILLMYEEHASRSINLTPAVLTPDSRRYLLNAY